MSAGLFLSGLIIISFISLWSGLSKVKVNKWHWLFIVASILLVSFMTELSGLPLQGNGHYAALSQIYGSDEYNNPKEHIPSIVYETARKYRKGCFSERLVFDNGDVFKLECSNYFERSVGLFRDDYIFMFSNNDNEQ
jgi:hypothetical protein